MPEETFDLVIRGQRVLTTAGTAPREVGVRGGKIAAVEPLGIGLSGAEVIELADDETLLPGLVDTHVHVNEPGRTEWEGFASATRAAAAGGVTTIIDMPLNSIPPTTTVDGLNRKREVAEGQAFVDVGFWGGAVPGNKADLRPLHDAGVFGFKCFLLPSGVDEFPHLDAEELEEDLAELKSFDSLMIVHAEDSQAIDRAPHPGGDQYAAFLASRPRGAENKAIAEVIERARWTGARAHIVHLSSSDALPMIASAKRDGVRLTVETCPHYLTLTAEEIPDGATAYKCCPPIREAANRELLWKGLQDGTIDCIVSDHSPVHPGPQGPGKRRLRRGLGRGFLAPAGPVAGLDGGPAPRHSAGTGGVLDGRAGPPNWPGWPPRASSPWATTPISRSSRPRIRSWWTPPSSGTRTPSPPTTARPSPGWSAGPSCAAMKSTAAPPADNCSAAAARGLRPQPGQMCAGRRNTASEPVVVHQQTALSAARPTDLEGTP